MMTQVQIFCDGACAGNPGKTGWGAVLISGEHQKEISGSAGFGTNNTAELYAAINALKALKYPCEVMVYSDSKYLIEGASGNWKVTTNRELWQELFKVAEPHRVIWQWVKGHNGHPFNEKANILANKAAGL